jgi:hypothetical protein
LATPVVAAANSNALGVLGLLLGACGTHEAACAPWRRYQRAAWVDEASLRAGWWLLTAGCWSGSLGILTERGATAPRACARPAWAWRTPTTAHGTEARSGYSLQTSSCGPINDLSTKPGAGSARHLDGRCLRSVPAPGATAQATASPRPDNLDGVPWRCRASQAFPASARHWRPGICAMVGSVPTSRPRARGRIRGLPAPR